MSPPTEKLSFLPDFEGRDRLYHSLDSGKDEIRVITIRNSSERSAPIHCFLETISIQHNHKTRDYEAISYFWGPTETTDRIIVHDDSQAEQPDCCGLEVPVTYALTDAIRQYRAAATELDRPLVLWTDAVCINQRDVAERSQQVAIMPRMYQAAKTVLVWLGEGDPIAELGLVNLFGLAKCRQARVTDRRNSDDWQTYIHSPPEQAGRALDAFDYDDFDAKPNLESLERVDAIIQNFNKPGGFNDDKCNGFRDMGTDITSWVHTTSALMNLSYWYRGWTFQEACANKHTSLQYGQTRCLVKNWNLVEGVITSNPDFFAWLKLQAPAVFDFYLWTFAAGSTSPNTFKFLESWLTAPGFGWDVYRRLQTDLRTLARSNRRTADPRDQVYSQMGCMTGLMLLHIKPDYSLTTEQVFTTTTIAILRKGRSWAQAPFFCPSESPFMSSWAIDFTLVPDPRFDVVYSRFDGVPFSAEAAASFRLQELQSGSLLTAGFVYDDVVTVASFGLSGRQPSCFGLFSSLLRENKACLLRNNPRLTVMNFWESFCRTLCMGTIDGASFGPQHAAACWRILTGGHNQMTREELSEDRLVLDEVNKMAVLVRRFHMKFIVTRNGHLGMAPPRVNIGDQIAILGAGAVPFALRGVGEQEDHRSAYILLGGCYVDGEAHGSSRLRTGLY